MLICPHLRAYFFNRKKSGEREEKMKDKIKFGNTELDIDGISVNNNSLVITFLGGDIADIESKFRVGQDGLETIQQIGSEGTVTATHELYDTFTAINKRIEAGILEDGSKVDLVEVVLYPESKVEAEIRHLKTRISATEEVTDTLLMEQLA